jgi:prefoldin subunit 5
MTLAEMIALASVVISIGTNVSLYTHLSSVMHTRFDSVERRLEWMQGNLHDLDVRMTKLER